MSPVLILNKGGEILAKPLLPTEQTNKMQHK